MAPQLTNWAGNIEFSAARLHRPASLDELAAVVTGSEQLRVLGTGHSFNRIADTTGDLVSVADLPTQIDVDTDASTVTVSAGTRYAELAAATQGAGLALHNLGSLPHISVGGACSTGTHGSGSRNGILATAVRALELMTVDGELVTLRAGDPDFAGAVVSLGSLGVLTTLTLALEPAFDVQQVVYDHVPHGELAPVLDEVMDADYSVSAWTDWCDPLGWQLWRKRRVGADTWSPPATYVGGRQADRPRHPIWGVDPVHCTEQLGVPGPWNERLPHFRREFTPSSGAELQSEFMVPREHGPAALAAVAELRHLIAPVLQVGELRTMAADGLWLSPAQGRDTLGIHFTWVLDPPAVAPVVAALGEVLAPFGARPHWGKVFAHTPESVSRLYDHWDDFAALLSRYDAAGRLRGDFVGSFFPVG